MSLTVEQLAKATKLSVSTVRVYASQRNLGKKVKGKRVFSQADVQTLLKGSEKSSPKKTIKAPARTASKKASKKTSKKSIKTVEVKAAKPKPVISKPIPVVATTVKPSFWGRLFGNRKTQKKVGLMDAKTTK